MGESSAESRRHSLLIVSDSIRIAAIIAAIVIVCVCAAAILAANELQKVANGWRP